MDLKFCSSWSFAVLMLGLSTAALAQTTVTYIHTDALGSVVATSDEAGNVTHTREYEPYGYELGGLSEGVGYTGHVQDPSTGLVYMQQRYYDPSIGRFLSTDPVQPFHSTGHNFNRYWYGNNNPYKYVDPDGRFGLPGALIGVVLEIGFQAAEGRFDIGDVAVAGGVGAFTGGVGGALGRQAARQTISVTRATTTTSAAGGASSGVGEIVSAGLDGEHAAPGDIARSSISGAVGAGVGARIGLNSTVRNQNMANAPVNRPEGIAGTIQRTTAEAVGAQTEVGSSGVQRATQGIVDVAAGAAARKPHEELK